MLFIEKNDAKSFFLVKERQIRVMKYVKFGFM